MLQMMDGHDMHQVFSIGNLKEIFVKGGSMEENNCVYFFKNCPSQFLSHWSSAEPVFCNEQFSFFSLQKPKQKPVLGGNIQILLYVLEWYIKRFSHQATV